MLWVVSSSAGFVRRIARGIAGRLVIRKRTGIVSAKRSELDGAEALARVIEAFPPFRRRFTGLTRAIASARRLLSERRQEEPCAERELHGPVAQKQLTASDRSADGASS